MVDNYRIQYAYFVDTDEPGVQGSLQPPVNNPACLTPEDKAIQTPNSDTPYSWIGMDLRAEPLVFTVPADREGPLLEPAADRPLHATTSTTSAAARRATTAGSFLIAGPELAG